MSFVEHEENRHHETNEGSQVVPAEVVLENNDGEERKHRKRDALLDDLELTSNPMRLAGTMKLYSKRAIAQEKSTTV